MIIIDPFKVTLTKSVDCQKKTIMQYIVQLVVYVNNNLAIIIMNHT